MRGASYHSLYLSILLDALIEKRNLSTMNTLSIETYQKSAVFCTFRTCKSLSCCVLVGYLALRTVTISFQGYITDRAE